MNNPGSEIILRNIQEKIQSEIDRMGIHCKLHTRIKEMNSLKEKIEKKKSGNNGVEYYSLSGKKIQDVFGFRIITYFWEDVNLLWDVFESKYDKVGDAYDKITEDNLDIFRPMRKNLICRMPKNESEIFFELSTLSENNIYSLVDDTFEIQFRTTLSEGWHEVDHVMRYKCKEDWKDIVEESRMLNGIYASLETNDKALKSLFDDLSYQHYKKKNWEAMMRTKFRLKFTRDPLDIAIGNIIDHDDKLAKKIFKIEREQFLEKIAFSRLHIPISFNNIIYLLNYLECNNKEIESLLPNFLKEDFELYLNTEK
jgi:ppGpp synthetase/RelA/SpoT-type nucleotidyltranferase